MNIETILEEVHAGRQSDPSLIALAKAYELERDAHHSKINLLKHLRTRFRATLKKDAFKDLDILLNN